MEEIGGSSTRFFLTLFVVFVLSNVQAQIQRREVQTSKTDQTIKIDGRLDETVWKNTKGTGSFVQLEPYNGRPSIQKTEVKLVYDNGALYVGAVLYDTAPDSIRMFVAPRDNLDNADYFGLMLDPFNNGQNAFAFAVSAGGVQMDMRMNDQLRRGEDPAWDAVWASSVSRNEWGWKVEMKIPYSALRFPKTDVQAWGLNLFRNIERHREVSTWNPIDNQISGLVKQNGVLTGIENVKPPVRLFLMPYFSAYVDYHNDQQNWNNYFRGGLDVKYGINEAFTLDMMLIPDFGQVQSDDQVLNLSPYEIQYAEKRQFFTEGVELFQRGDIFYSRRVGGIPMNIDAVDEALQEHEIVERNPLETQLYNATKVSGRTSNGLGVGFFNALTRTVDADLLDTITGERRSIQTQPMANYNMIVLDQALNNQSYISLFNTNVYRGSQYYSANVTGTEFRFENRDNSLAFGGVGVGTQKYYSSPTDDEFGYRLDTYIEKIKGKFQWGIQQELETEQYDPNDMGYSRRNNNMAIDIEASYNLLDPFGPFLKQTNYVRIGNDAQFRPSIYKGSYLMFRSFGTFTNHLTVGMYGFIRPWGVKDFYEPRVDGSFFYRDPSWSFSGFLSSDYRKTLAIDLELSYEAHSNFSNQREYVLEFEPRLKLGNRGIALWEVDAVFRDDEMGYVYDEEWNGEHDIYFGVRDNVSIENVLESRFSFNTKNTVSLRFRHYWANALYRSDFYELQKDGTLLPSDYSDDHDQNFNAFNIDMGYSWEFAPGSQMSVVWKNSIFSENHFSHDRYLHNLSEVLKLPQVNSFSIKLIYHLDFLYLRPKST
jgi:hypothetical protein